MKKCKSIKCGCNNEMFPFICTNNQNIPSCEDRSLTTSNTTDPLGYSGVTMITPEVNQISAYKEHLEFVNSPEPLSGIKKHSVIRFAQKMLDYIANIFRGRNVGTGADIFKETTIGNLEYKDFKRLKSTESIDITPNSDDISFNVNSTWLQEQFPVIPEVPIQALQSIGEGTDIYAGMLGTTGQFRRVKDSNTIRATVDADGSLVLEAPQSPDESIKQYYVSDKYIGEGNGSILKPYSKITSAFRDIIGNGTAVDPQFRDSIIYLLSDITVEQADLDLVPELKNRLSVNTITVTSASATRRALVYNGSSAFDYPYDTRELCNQDLIAHGGGVSGVSLSQIITLKFLNINLVSLTTVGVIRSWSYDAHNNFNGSEFTAGITLEDVGYYSDYRVNDSSVYKQLYNENGTPATLYESPVFGQTSQPDNIPHMLLYGLGNVKEGAHNMKNITGIGHCGAVIKLERTSCSFKGFVELNMNPYKIPVQSLTPTLPGRYKPKDTISMIESDSSWCNFQQLDHIMTYPKSKLLSGNYDLIGGYNAFMSIVKNVAVSPHFTIQVEKGFLANAFFNYLVTINTVNPTNQTPSLLLQGMKYSRVVTDKGAFIRTAGTAIPTVNGTASEFSNVKEYTVSNVYFDADVAIINSYQYERATQFANDTQAIAAGLIVGNIYYNSTLTAMKQVR